MSDLVIVKSLEAQTRGRLIAGTSRLYHVNTETGYLHEFLNGSPAIQPGCHAEDAADLLRVPGYRKVSAPPVPRPIVAPEPEPEPEPERDPEPESQAPPADLSILDLSVSKLRKALETGEHDDNLQALLDAEEAGKTRKGAVAAINERLNPSGA